MLRDFVLNIITEGLEFNNDIIIDGKFGDTYEIFLYGRSQQNISKV